MSRTFKPAQVIETGPRPNIPLVRVKSRQVAAIGYDAETKTLAVQFVPRSGDLTVAPVYHHADICAQAHADFLAAESIGHHYNTVFKGQPFKKYPAEPLPAAQEA